MGIIYCEKDRTFTLQTKNTTYQMQVDNMDFCSSVLWKKDRRMYGLSSDTL